MSTALIQGNFMAKATKVALSNNKKGQPELRIEFEIVGGDHGGRKLPYSGLFTEKAVKYTRNALRELGWSGAPLPKGDGAASVALSGEIMKAAKTVPIEVTIASWQKDDGTVSEWSTVRNVGTYSAPVVPPSDSQIADVNRWLAEAADDGEQSPVPF